MFNKEVLGMQRFLFLCKKEYMNNRRSFFLGLVCSLMIISCAKRGSIGGGPKDETAPVFVKSFPPNYSTSFKAKEILTFRIVRLEASHTGGELAREISRPFLIWPPMMHT